MPACVPRIHDITTDTENPPLFVDILERRAKAPNPPEYAGPEVARKQEKAYPHIQPLLLTDAPEAAFERAFIAAESMGWEIVSKVPGEGRIEATATTRIFRFKDDVVVRIRPEESGSRVDVRSKSRLGRSDLGANAKRISRYLSAVKGVEPSR